MFCPVSTKALFQKITRSYPQDFATSIGCFRNERDALRIIGAGGFYINQERVLNPEEVLVHGIHILDNGLTVVRVGKKNYYIVEWT